MRHECIITSIALAFLPAQALAASDDDLAQIRREIQELKSAYEARIHALEQRLKEAEARAAPAAPTAPAAIGNAFNPAMSVILQGRYANLSRNSAAGPRGFSLSESEVTMTANVDHKFAGALTFALTPEDTIEIEEAYATMLAPVHGVTPKFGRFLSGIGYLNEQHQHAWDFVDAPLAYQAFLGGQHRNDGVQLRWLAPTEHYVEVGGEVGSGRDKNGSGSGAVFAHTGGDVGASHSWRAGLSYLHARESDGVPATKLAIADFVWKWAPNGNSRERNFKLQGEYFHQTQGDLKPKGGYVQAIYQFMPLWRIGARYDRLDPTTFTPRRSSVMVDYSPSEFSRIRLQLARSQAQPDLTDNQLFLQYILSLGAHGAHRY